MSGADGGGAGCGGARRGPARGGAPGRPCPGPCSGPCSGWCLAWGPGSTGPVRRRPGSPPGRGEAAGRRRSGAPRGGSRAGEARRCRSAGRGEAAASGSAVGLREPGSGASGRCRRRGGGVRPRRLCRINLAGCRAGPSRWASRHGAPAAPALWSVAPISWRAVTGEGSCANGKDRDVKGGDLSLKENVGSAPWSSALALLWAGCPHEEEGLAGQQGQAPAVATLGLPGSCFPTPLSLL